MLYIFYVVKCSFMVFCAKFVADRFHLGVLKESVLSQFGYFFTESRVVR